MKTAIDSLLESLSDGNSKHQDNNEEILAENFETTSRIGDFFSLPFSNICSIVKKSKTQNVKTLIELILGLYESGHKNITVLLDYLDLPELKLDECIHIISSFKSSPICVRTSSLYEEYSIRPEIDWEFTVSEKEKEISEIKSEIEAKHNEITNYNKIKNENQRKISNLSGQIKDMQTGIIKLLKSNEEKQIEYSNPNSKIIDIKNKIAKLKMPKKIEENTEEVTKLINQIEDNKNKLKNLQFSGIFKYLSGHCGGNVVDKGIVRVEASSKVSNCYPKYVFEVNFT